MALPSSSYDVPSLSIGDARRPADPASQVGFSAAVIVGAWLFMFALAMWAERVELSFRLTLWLSPVIFAGVVATAVALRARSARRRTAALVAVAAYLAALLVAPFILGDPIDVDRFVKYSWVVTSAGVAADLLLVAAWGLARRHGTWWWVGLLPAAGLQVAEPHLVAALLDAVPLSLWTETYMVLGLLVPVLGGAICWVIDLLTTRRTPPTSAQ